MHVASFPPAPMAMVSMQRAMFSSSAYPPNLNQTPLYTSNFTCSPLLSGLSLSLQRKELFFVFVIVVFIDLCLDF